jgi:hypothetical protein
MDTEFFILACTVRVQVTDTLWENYFTHQLPQVLCCLNKSEETQFSFHLHIVHSILFTRKIWCSLPKKVMELKRFHIIRTQQNTVLHKHTAYVEVFYSPISLSINHEDREKLKTLQKYIHIKAPIHYTTLHYTTLHIEL